MVKVTFTLDDETVEAIRALAQRRRKPQSLVVREAIAVYGRQEEKLDDRARARKLRIIDELKKRPPTRSRAATERELRDIRRGRREGWRRPGE
jgi:predicted transcriptional regulator